MNKNTILIGAFVAALLIGSFGGYTLRGTQAPLSGTHAMSGGMMMSDNSMGMGSEMSAMTSGLQGKTGDDFDQVFLSEMIVHHQGAVGMAQQALTRAKHTEIRKMATNIISAQTTEIDQMQTWLKDWYQR